MPLSEKAKEILKTVAVATVEAKAEVIAKRGVPGADPAEIEKMRKDAKASAQTIHDHLAAIGAGPHGSGDDDDDDTEKVLKSFGIDPAALGIDLAKAGATYSKATKDHHDAMHTAVMKLGADCDATKSAEIGSIAKLGTKVDRFMGIMGAVIAKLNGQPIVPAAATKNILVTKAEDGKTAPAADATKTAEPGKPVTELSDINKLDAGIQATINGGGVPLRSWY